MANRLEKFRVIITGVTGMVGEGVLLECLESPAVEHVLVLGRRPYGVTHPKLEECIVKDFTDLGAVEDRLKGFDACFNCAGVSSAGMSEAEYTKVAYDMVLSFAAALAKLNPKMIFTHVTGAGTDGTEKGRVMWSRVKGRTENALARLPLGEVYNFRPGLMKPTKGQRSIKTLYRVAFVLMPIAGLFFPMLTMHQVGRAMIHAVTKGYAKKVLEVADIAALAE
jgi:uncharacterized protein YbjT (DUF2867 family)